MNTLADCLGNIWSKITKPIKTAFFTALISGFVAHLSSITNHLFNHDSILYTLIDPNSTFSLQQGKWLSQPVNQLLRGDIAATGIIIPLGILFLALTASLAVSILKIRSSLWAGIVGAVHILFPAVMCANAYFASAIFFFALLLAALSVFFTVRYRFGFLAGILLLTLSCGIYSAYIGYAAGLFLLYALLELVENHRPVGKILSSGAIFLLVLIVSAALYYLILQIVLSIKGITLSSYRNINQIGEFSLSALPRLMIQTYKKVFYYLIYGVFIFQGEFQIDFVFRAMNWCLLGCSAALCFVLTLKTGCIRKIGRIALSLLLIGVFPLAIHVIAVLGKNADTHWIMCYPFVLIYLIPVLFADRLELLSGSEPAVIPAKPGAFRIVVRTGAICVLVFSTLLLRQWYFIANQGYDFLRQADQNAISAGTMLVSDLRDFEGYTASTPVLFAGSAAPEAFQYTTGHFTQVAGHGGNGYTGLRLPITDMKHLQILLQNYIGVSIVYADDEVAARINNSEEVAAMPVYPAEGSIRQIDGCLVVKLSDITPANGEPVIPHD
ncbi:MAG: glucosyltransferase domain-containing protein [Christensenella sp.]|nr:glucosyltransferase domain-containing protein [Christensenella sp.]